jgi:hypothetical protein
MTLLQPLPDAPLVKELLGMLFDGLAVKSGAKLDVAAGSACYAAVYVGATGLPAALCVCDIAFAANCGAALSLLPPGVAKEAAKSKDLTPVMLANLHEVMNICTRLILREDSPHLKLRDLVTLAALPAETAAGMRASKVRIDFELDIVKYGPGKLAVIFL